MSISLAGKHIWFAKHPSSLLGIVFSCWLSNIFSGHCLSDGYLPWAIGLSNPSLPLKQVAKINPSQDTHFPFTK